MKLPPSTRLLMLALSLLAGGLGLGVGSLLFSTEISDAALAERVVEFYPEHFEEGSMPDGGPTPDWVWAVVQGHNLAFLMEEERALYRDEVWMWRRIPVAFAFFAAAFLVLVTRKVRELKAATPPAAALAP